MNFFAEAVREPSEAAHTHAVVRQLVVARAVAARADVCLVRLTADPVHGDVVKIAKALGVPPGDLFRQFKRRGLLAVSFTSVSVIRQAGIH